MFSGANYRTGNEKKSNNKKSPNSPYFFSLKSSQKPSRVFVGGLSHPRWKKIRNYGAEIILVFLYIALFCLLSWLLLFLFLSTSSGFQILAPGAVNSSVLSISGNCCQSIVLRVANHKSRTENGECPFIFTPDFSSTSIQTTSFQFPTGWIPSSKITDLDQFRSLAEGLPS